MTPGTNNRLNNPQTSLLHEHNHHHHCAIIEGCGGITNNFPSRLLQRGKTRTKITDGTATQVAPFPRTMQCRFRTLASQVFLRVKKKFMFYL